MLKTIPMETVSTGHTNSCKVQSGVPSGLDFCYVTCCLHSPPKSWLLCQASPFSSSHMTFTPLRRAPYNFSSCVTELHLSHSQGQSLPSANGCPRSGGKHTTLVLSLTCSYIIAASSVCYSQLIGKLYHLSPESLHTLRQPTGKRVRPTTLLSLLR